MYVPMGILVGYFSLVGINSHWSGNNAIILCPIYIYSLWQLSLFYLGRPIV